MTSPSPFKKAFAISSELVQNSILDFLYVVDGKQITSADFTPRNNSLDFEGTILPVLQALCPSFRLNGSDFDTEGRIRHHLSWDMGTLEVPSFVIEESDRQFKDLMDVLTFDDDDKESEIGEDGEGDNHMTWTNPYVHEENMSSSGTTTKRELDVYDFIPMDLI
jgi:hypothetical protein